MPSALLDHQYPRTSKVLQSKPDVVIRAAGRSLRLAHTKVLICVCPAIEARFVSYLTGKNKLHLPEHGGESSYHLSC